MMVWEEIFNGFFKNKVGRPAGVGSRSTDIQIDLKLIVILYDTSTRLVLTLLYVVVCFVLEDVKKKKCDVIFIFKK